MLNDLKTALMHNFGPLTLYLLKAQIMLQGFPVNFKQLEGMVPTNNGDILHRLILGKTISGEVKKKTGVIKTGTVSVGSVEPF